MANAYLIVDTKILDAARYEEYKNLAKPIIERFGGEYLARGGELYSNQCDLWTPTRIVVIKFESMQKAKKIICTVSDQRKAKAVQSTVHGPVTNLCPASYLQKHKNTFLMLDEAAASLLRN